MTGSVADTATKFETRRVLGPIDSLRKCIQRMQPRQRTDLQPQENMLNELDEVSLSEEKGVVLARAGEWN